MATEQTDVYSPFSAVFDDPDDNNDPLIEANPDFTLPVEEVSYSEFRNNDSLDMFR